MPAFRITPRDELILKLLDENGAMNAKQISDTTGAPLGSIHRRLATLRDNRLVEFDPSPRTELAYYYKLPDAAKSGARITSKGISISFNKFADKVVRTTEPNVAEDWKEVWRVVAGICNACAMLIDSTDSVSQSQLLEIRKRLSMAVDETENFVAVGKQLLRNERIWNKKTLVEEVVEKTDHILTRDDYLQLARVIIQKVGLPPEVK